MKVLIFIKLLLNLAVPANLRYSRGIGSPLALFLVVHITTGIFLAERYVGDTELAFSTIGHIKGDVFYG
jgi:quinol-cytochrome oxidoreductase complex cytochrome b subunit